MCRHIHFDILFYDGSMMIRQCKECHQVEMRVEYWTDRREVYAALASTDVEGENQKKEVVE